MKKLNILTFILFINSLFVYTQNYPNSLKLKDTTIIWVDDSIYSYIGVGNEWQLETISRKLSRDESGHVTNGDILFLNNENNIIEKKFKYAITYNTDHSMNTYIEYAWNNLLNNWNEISTIKYTDDNEIAEVYFKKWDFDQNNVAGGIKYDFSKSEDQKVNLIENWNTDSTKWVTKERIVYTYNNDLLINESFYEGEESDYYKKRTYLYNYENQISAIEIKSEQNNFLKHIYIHSATNEDITITQHWNKSEDKWENFQKNQIVYSENNLVLFEFIFNWIESYSIWEEKGEESYTYNENGNIISKITRQKDLSDTWHNINQIVYAYDNDNLIRKTFMNWSNELNNWQNSYQYNFSFDDNRMLIETTEQEWNLNDNSWYFRNMAKYFYDNNMVVTQIENYFWNESIWEKINKKIIYNSQINLVNSSNIESMEMNINVFPNPTDGIIFLDAVNGINCPLKITVYDINGNVVLKQKMTSRKTNLNLTGKQQGMYLIDIEHNKNIKVIVR